MYCIQGQSITGICSQASKGTITMHPLIAEWLKKRRIVEEAEAEEQKVLGWGEKYVEKPDTENLRPAGAGDVRPGAIVWIHEDRESKFAGIIKGWHWKYVETLRGDDHFLTHDD